MFSELVCTSKRQQKAKHRGRQLGNQSRTRRALFEPLEDRRMLSADVKAMALDSHDNTYVLGQFSDWADFDPGPGQAWLKATATTSPWNPYVAKYSPGNDLLWVKQLDVSAGSLAIAYKLVSDSSDNLYLSAAFKGTVSLDSQSFTTAGNAALVAKLDSSDGHVLWAETFGDDPANANVVAKAAELVYDGAGSLYVSGGMKGSTGDFDPGPGQVILDAQGHQDRYVAKLSAADGQLQWAKNLGTNNFIYDEGGLASDATGVYVSGVFAGSVNIAGLIEDTTGAWIDGFLIKLDPANGSFVWGKQFADANTGGRDVATDGSAVYLMTYGTDSANSSNYTLSSFASDNGSLLWSKSQLYGRVGVALNSIQAVGNSLYLTGVFRGVTDFDPGPGQYITNSDGGDVFIQKLTTAGDFQWARRIGAPIAITNLGDEGRAIAVDSVGNVITVGTFNPGSAGATDFDPGIGVVDHVAVGVAQYGFVSRLNSAGQYQSAFAIGGYNNVIDNGDAGYSLVGTGWTTSTGGGSYANDYNRHAKGTGSNKAQWTFANLPVGSYEVYATWVANSENATNAQYKINGVNAPLVNQRNAGSSFTSLGTYNVTSGSVTVTLSDLANGYVVADAIQLISRGPSTPAALLAASTATRDLSAASLAETQLQPIVVEAFHRWQLAGINAADLGSIDVRIGDLPGTTLGLASGNTIWIDTNAAGWGWFVDRTPGSDREFTRLGNQGEQDRMDLLTVVMHELGHVLGYDHDEDGLMAETLATGVRRADVDHGHAASVDDIFYEASNQHADSWLGGWLSDQLEGTHPRAKRRR